MASTESSPVLPLSRTVRLRDGRWGAALLILNDIAALEFCLFLGYSLRIAVLPWLPVELGPAQYRGLALGLLAIPVAYGLGGFYPGYGMNPVERLRKRIHTTGAVFALLLAWDTLVLDRQWSRGILVFTGVFALLLPPFLDETLRHALARKGIWQLPVMILGAGRTGSLLIGLLRANPSLGLKPAVLLDDDPSKWDSQILGLPVIGPLSMANHFRGTISTAIVAIRGLDPSRTTQLLREIQLPHVILLPALAETQSLWVTARDFGGIIGLDFQRHGTSDFNARLKRSLDLLIAVPLSLLALPVLLLAAIAIKLIDRGPVFFSQVRVGLDGHEFSILKLRTMYRDSEMMLLQYLEIRPDQKSEWESRFKLKHDPRILPVIGRFLRRFSLDELPQLIHVLRGEMSMVGPRPFPPYHLGKFSESFRSLRHSVSPGLTGLWQISARGDGDLTVQQSLDTYYIRNWSPWLDLHILVHTVRAVLLGKGAY
jgi:Undecaprenyl-phosphate galactose phosphotransferase WbaP